MQTKKLMKLVFVITIIMGIVINACKKNECPTVEPTPTPIAGTCPAKDTSYMKVNGTVVISNILFKNQTATQFGISSSLCAALLPGINIQINKAGLAEGQTYDKTVIATCFIRNNSGVVYDIVTAAQIKLLTYTPTCIKITYSMSMAQTGSSATATVTEGVLELKF
jgi:hypothetical protein